MYEESKTPKMGVFGGPKKDRCVTEKVGGGAAGSVVGRDGY